MTTATTASQYIPGWDNAARYTGLSKQTLHRAEKAGLLRPLRVGSRVLFTPEMLDGYIASQTDAD